MKGGFVMKNTVILAMWMLGLFAIAQATWATVRITVIGNDPARFGDVLIGQSVERTFSVRNDGAEDLNITINEPTLGDFVLVGGRVSFTLKPGATYAFAVRCVPRSVGVIRGTINITYGAQNDPRTLNLLCNGIGPLFTFVTGETLDFGDVEVNRTVEREVVIRNGGTENLRGTVSTLPAPFALSRGEGAFDIAPGRIHTITVRCTPPNRGTFRATLEISGINNPAEPNRTVMLICTGIGPEITLVQESTSDTGPGPGPHLTLDFGTVVVNQTSDRSFEIRNHGERPLTGTVNAPSSPFSIVSGGGSFSLRPGETRSVTVRCQLRAQGGAVGTLTISGINDTDEPTKTITLVCGRAIPDIDVNPLRLDFGSQPQGTPSTPQRITITNAGAAPLKLIQVTIRPNPGGVFSLLNAPSGCPRFSCTLTPGQSIQFEVQATPRSNQVGVITATLRIVSDDPDERMIDIPLQIQSVPPTSSLTVTGLEVRQAKNALEFQAMGSGIAGVSVVLYDLRGRKVVEASSKSSHLRLEALDAQGRPLANGVYFYVVTYTGVDGSVAITHIKKLVLLR
jgi:hypothetical protein